MEFMYNGPDIDSDTDSGSDVELRLYNVHKDVIEDTKPSDNQKHESVIKLSDTQIHESKPEAKDTEKEKVVAKTKTQGHTSPRRGSILRLPAVESTYSKNFFQKMSSKHVASSSVHFPSVPHRAGTMKGCVPCGHAAVYSRHPRDSLPHLPARPDCIHIRRHEENEVLSWQRVHQWLLKSYNQPVKQTNRRRWKQT